MSPLILTCPPDRGNFKDTDEETRSIMYRHLRPKMALAITVSFVALTIASVRLVGIRDTTSKEIDFSHPVVYTFTYSHVYQGLPGETSSHLTTTVLYSDSLHYYYYLSNGGMYWRDGLRTIDNPSQGVLAYGNHEIERPSFVLNDPSSIVDSMCDLWGPGLIDIESVASLASSNVLSLTTSADMFGRETALILIEDSVHEYDLTVGTICRVWYDIESGFRYRIELNSENGEENTYSVVDIAQMEEGVLEEYSFAGDLLDATSTELTAPYSPTQSAAASGAEDVRVFASGETVSGYVFGGPAFIMDNYEDDRMDYWAVVQSASNGEDDDIIVVQANKEGSLRIAGVDQYWPSHYRVAGGLSTLWDSGIPPGTVLTDTVVIDNTPVNLYHCNSGKPGGEAIVAVVDRGLMVRAMFVARNEPQDDQALIAVIGEYLQLP